MKSSNKINIRLCPVIVMAYTHFQKTFLRLKWEIFCKRRSPISINTWMHLLNTKDIELKHIRAYIMDEQDFNWCCNHEI